VLICNQSLLLLGQDTIQSLGENTAEAKACAAFYDDARDTVLRDIKPPFIAARVAPGALLAPPLSGVYIYQYPVPVDCLLVTDLGTALNTGQPTGAYQDSLVWEVEGSGILTNQPVMWIKFLADVDGVEASMDATFVKALAAYLASEIAYTITESNAKVGAMMQLYGVRHQDCLNVYGRSRSTQDTFNTQLLRNR
jgi:hypothetical protein